MSDIAKQIDSYIKRTIINSVKDFKKYKSKKYQNELSIDEVRSKLNNDETALLSYVDNYAVFSFTPFSCTLTNTLDQVS